MTPEQARQLLEGTTPGPWEAESLTYDEPAYPEPIVELQVTARNGDQVAARSDFDSDAYEPSLNFDLIAAAPEMAAMIAGMHEEWVGQYLDREGKWTTIFAYPTRKEVAYHLDHECWNAYTHTRIVRRYVTAPQPLGEEQ